MTVNRLFRVYIMLIICSFVPLSFPASSYAAEIPKTVVEVFHNPQDIVDLELEATDTEVSLESLRHVLEPHGIIIKYNSPYESRRDTTIFTLDIGSKKVALNIGSRTSGRFFFLEYPPIIINGQTMVPSNFIQEVLDTIKNREQHLEKIAASDYPTDEDSMANKKGYKYYCLIIGPETGPTFDQAIIYVTKHKLLYVVTRTEETPHRFVEYGPRSTIVVGKDEQGREKAVWLTQNKYTGEISVITWVYIDEVISREVICEKLQKRGFTDKEIWKVYLAPDTPKKLLWYVQAHKNNIYYYLSFDCFSGEVCEERSIKR